MSPVALLGNSAGRWRGADRSSRRVWVVVCRNGFGSSAYGLVGRGSSHGLALAGFDVPLIVEGMSLVDGSHWVAWLHCIRLLGLHNGRLRESCGVALRVEDYHHDSLALARMSGHGVRAIRFATVSIQRPNSRFISSADSSLTSSAGSVAADDGPRWHGQIPLRPARSDPQCEQASLRRRWRRWVGLATRLSLTVIVRFTEFVFGFEGVVDGDDEHRLVGLLVRHGVGHFGFGEHLAELLVLPFAVCALTLIVV